MQGGGGVRQPLLPACVHCAPAEFVVLRRALRRKGPIDELNDIHLRNAAERVQPFALLRFKNLGGQQFFQLVNRMANIVLLLEPIGIDPGAARIADVVLPFADLFEICRVLSETLEYVDLKGETAAARVIVEHILQWRV